MRKWFEAILKILFGAYFALTSVYCLLAFLPYTYYSLIKSPAYSWIPWFARHHALLFWLAWTAAAVSYGSRRRRAAYFVCFGILACAGIFLSVHPFLTSLESNRSAYLGSVAALWAILLIVSFCGFRDANNVERETPLESHLSYATGIALAAGVALLSVIGTRLRSYSDTRIFSFHVSDIHLTFWSVISHALLAIVLISILNLVHIAASKSVHSRLVRQGLLGLLIFGSLWALSVRFLENALSFEGWPAHLYAASLAGALTLLGFSTARPLLASDGSGLGAGSAGRRTFLIAVSSLFVLAALALPTLVGGGDWNGLIQGTFTLLFWVVLSFCVFRLWPTPGRYSLRGLLVVLLLSVFSYEALQATNIFWAKPLGATDDDIERSIENYAARDASFNLANRLLGNGPKSEPCGELCRILREYTEVRGAQARFDLKLVDPLVATRGERPNIFLFVIDSMRPDYLGAYNPKATFTPNLDALARDSIVLRNVWTPYAGTSLSEPAIWAGALLLHAHFMQPFERVNSLEKLAKTDGYQIVVSYDEVLREILSPSDDLIKLDTDKKLWNQLEVCSTVQQAESVIDHRSDSSRPIFFYAQPKNVHQFARNNLPQAKAANWPAQPGFNYRISFELHQVDECMGGFVAWLRVRGLYDNSILIVTSDHGDATGELGRNSHSVVIYPEVMRVPLIVHLPKTMEKEFVHDDDRISALIDITPSLYYLLGHRPIVSNPLFGHPLFTETLDELHGYHRDELFLASDVRAAYGLLADNGKYFYATYDSPAQSYLYDLAQDPKGEHDILTSALKKHYDEQIIAHLHEIADFYGYKPGIGSLLTSSR
ncbi:MAG TPA: sulfatase-like hydrolase/transferase [Candidatus Acidoferrum sp.]|nr:sulfatase-like hydrolase/transferase [Candidatus Acidoferrum sp.]